MLEKKYRLGIDLGSTSLGWCMLELGDDDIPKGIIKMGVRIFSDGRDAKSKEPLSVARRGYRGQRRNLDRYLQRMRSLINYLIQHGFLPEDEVKRNEVFQINPYLLRAKALDEALTPAEFARALIHLARRRGFRSNRKVLSDKKTQYTEAINNLKENLEQSHARTLGEYLWMRYNHTPEDKAHTRTPLKFRYEKNNEQPEPIFPLREMVEHEFQSIWQKQSRYSSQFTDEHKQAIQDIIFFQRPLKPVPKGKCQLMPEFLRAPKAHPLFQEFRIRQDLNNINLINVFTNAITDLSDEQYAILYELLSHKEKVTFKAMRKALFAKQADDYRFNLETNDRKELLGDLTYHELHKDKNAHLSGMWDALGIDTQSAVIETIISDLDDIEAAEQLVSLGIPQDNTDDFLNLKLPSDYCHLSLQALGKILPYMRERQKYHAACQAAGFSHSGEYDGTVYHDGDLPYYGKLLKRETIELNRKTGDHDADLFGRINNPTVHIAMNQLRLLVNALCKKYGPPSDIILELGKEIKLGEKEKDRLNKIANQNKKINQEVDQILADHDLPANHNNRLRVKLWKELAANEIDRRCVYSGVQISFTDLFSSKIEIDHILPKSRTYDDSTANKILCTRDANRYKKERSPFEAFGQSQDGYTWGDIIARAKHLPENKQRRFLPDAMERYENKEELLGRMLNDTRYMSRVAMKYMQYICGDRHVWTVTGLHTGLLRGKWGLNTALGDGDSKDRSDHRHHAIDAFVIALTTRSMIRNLANNIEASRERFIENLDPPYPGFDHEDFKAHVQNIITSHKPDQIHPQRLKGRNQTGGALVDETAYAFEGIDPRNPKYSLYSVRKSISDITEKNYDSIAAPEYVREIGRFAESCRGEDFKSKVKQWAAQRNIKKVKLIFSMNPKGMVPIYDKDGRAFKFMSSGENLFADIYLKDPTSPDCKWSIEIVNSYNAHQPGFVPQWKKDYPKARKIMRVFKNDVVAVDNLEGIREYRRVKMMTKGRLFLREINVAKKEKHLEDIGEQYPPNKLMELRACKAGIDILGRCFDPLMHGNEQHS